MKKLSVVFCLLLSGLIVSGQTFTHDFGKYSGEEFSMKSYDKDKSAEAVIIYDIGKSYFVNDDNGFKLIFERKTKIKILSKEGLEWAQIEIPFYVDKESEDVKDVEGNTYNFENGKLNISKFDTKNIYEIKHNSLWKSKKFAMPEVKVGSVIEYKYKIISPYFFNFRSWEFQTKIPVIYSEYLTKMTPFYAYTFILQGTNKFDETEKYEDSGIENSLGSIRYHDMVYKYVMKDVPAFKDESFITSQEDYIMKLNFQLSSVHHYDGSESKIITTWPKLIDDLTDDERFGKYQRQAEKNAKIAVDSWGLSSKTELEKASYILKFVKGNYNWNGEIDKRAHKTVKEFVKQKTGNSAEINLYLIGMLKAAGFETSPVIISTRKNGKIPMDYPFEHFFNYVLASVKIDGKLKLLDATEPLCTFDEIPTRCMNDKGLIVRKEKNKDIEWVNFKFGKSSDYFETVDLWFNEKMDSIRGDFNVTANGYEALRLRNLYYENYDVLQKNITNPNLVINDSLKIENGSDPEKSFIINYKASMSLDKVDNKMIINPFCGNAISSNPLKQDTRNFPIDIIYKQSKHFKTTIHIPDGYKFQPLRENLLINNELITIHYVSILSDNSVTIDGYYSFPLPVYEANDYAKLKAFYNIIIRNFNQQLVLISSK